MAASSGAHQVVNAFIPSLVQSSTLFISTHIPGGAQITNRALPAPGPTTEHTYSVLSDHLIRSRCLEGNPVENLDSRSARKVGTDSGQKFLCGSKENCPKKTDSERTMVFADEHDKDASKQQDVTLLTCEFTESESVPNTLPPQVVDKKDRTSRNSQNMALTSVDSAIFVMEGDQGSVPTHVADIPEKTMRSSTDKLDPVLCPPSVTTERKDFLEGRKEGFQQQHRIMHQHQEYRQGQFHPSNTTALDDLFPLFLLAVAAMLYWQGMKRSSGGSAPAKNWNFSWFTVFKRAKHEEPAGSSSESITMRIQDCSSALFNPSTNTITAAAAAKAIVIDSGTTTTAVATAPVPARPVHDDVRQVHEDILQQTHHQEHWAGNGILASPNDLDLPTEEFAAGCSLLQATARGDLDRMERLIRRNPSHVNFRDYDRRSPLHVAASEGHLEACYILIEKYRARVNRSDRWGGSPLDDAERHQHEAVAQYLRQVGATSGSMNRCVKIVQAATDCDFDEVRLLLDEDKRASKPSMENTKEQKEKDSSDTTALHVAARGGHTAVVKILLDEGAHVNALDRWGRTPLDEAVNQQHTECVKILESYGAIQGQRDQMGAAVELDCSYRRSVSNMEIDFFDVQMINRIGAGAFGEIYKARWRGTLVAAKIIRTSKINTEWLHAKSLNIGHDCDETGMSQTEKELALADFRQEISVVKSLRHPNIVLMLAYSRIERFECLLSELCKCSLLDVFKTNLANGTRMPRKTQFVYAQQLAQGMHYLHTCSPPIIHRDLKPANLLIDYSGTLKISDFGLSKFRHGDGEGDEYKMTGETGSYRFMAPEVFRHEKYNEKVDVYSFAMILYYLFTGRPPWPSLPGYEAVRLAAEEGNRPDFPRDLDVRSVNLLMICWDDTPSARPSFGKILDFIHDYMQEAFCSDMNSVPTPGALEVTQPCECVIL